MAEYAYDSQALWTGSANRHGTQLLAHMVWWGFETGKEYIKNIINFLLYYLFRIISI